MELNMPALLELLKKLQGKSGDKTSKNDDIITTNAIAGESSVTLCELWKPKRGVYKLHETKTDDRRQK
jgi:hypothetical protein